MYFSISISPTVSPVYRITAVLRYIDPWSGLPYRARRPLPLLPASAPPRIRVSRSDAHRDAGHAEGRPTRRLLSMAGATMPNKTILCENCYKCSMYRTACSSRFDINPLLRRCARFRPPSAPSLVDAVREAPVSTLQGPYRESDESAYRRSGCTRRASRGRVHSPPVVSAVRFCGEVIVPTLNAPQPVLYYFLPDDTASGVSVDRLPNVLTVGLMKVE